MALSGSFNTTAHDGYYYTLSWTASQSVPNNNSVISWQLHHHSAGGYIAERTLKVVVAGQTVVNKTDRVERREGVVASGQVTVSHNTAGAASFSASVQAALYYSTVNVSGSSSWTLNTIPRATTPTLSASTADMGASVTINTPRASTAFTHDLYYSFAGGDWVGIAYGVATQKTWTIPDLTASIPKSTSGTMTIKCVTYNGSTWVGEKTVLLTVKVPADVLPVVSSVTAVEATAGLAEKFGAFVQGKSTLNVNITAAGAKGSTVTEYQATFNGQRYTGQSWKSSELTHSGEAQIKVAVKDSRERWSEPFYLTISALEYSAPKIQKIQPYRCTSDGVPDDKGQSLMVEYGYTVSTLNNKNISTATWEYKRATDPDTSFQTFQTGQTLGAESTLYELNDLFSSDYEYDIRLTVVDWFGASTDMTALLPSEEVVLDILANGKGIAFGKTAERNGVEFGWKPHGDEFLDAVYPVGSFYMTEGAENPATLFGGVWEKLRTFYGGELIAFGTSSATNGTATTSGEAISYSNSKFGTKVYSLTNYLEGVLSWTGSTLRVDTKGIIGMLEAVITVSGWTGSTIQGLWFNKNYTDLPAGVSLLPNDVQQGLMALRASAYSGASYNYIYKVNSDQDLTFDVDPIVTSYNGIITPGSSGTRSSLMVKAYAKGGVTNMWVRRE